MFPLFSCGSKAYASELPEHIYSVLIVAIESSIDDWRRKFMIITQII